MLLFIYYLEYFLKGNFLHQLFRYIKAVQIEKWNKCNIFPFIYSFQVIIWFLESFKRDNGALCVCVHDFTIMNLWIYTYLICLNQLKLSCSFRRSLASGDCLKWLLSFFLRWPWQYFITFLLSAILIYLQTDSWVIINGNNV